MNDRRATRPAPSCRQSVPCPPRGQSNWPRRCSDRARCGGRSACLAFRVAFLREPGRVAAFLQPPRGFADTKRQIACADLFKDRLMHRVDHDVGALDVFNAIKRLDARARGACSFLLFRFHGCFIIHTYSPWQPALTRSDPACSFTATARHPALAVAWRQRSGPRRRGACAALPAAPASGRAWLEPWRACRLAGRRGPRD